MTTPMILPMAKALYLCEGYITSPSTGKTDLINIFNALRPASYPYRHRDFVVYSRLSGGLGAIPFFVEVHDANNANLIHVSNTLTMTFPDRDQTLELAFTMPNLLFPHSGVYTVELYLDNQWSCDATLKLL